MKGVDGAVAPSVYRVQWNEATSVDEVGSPRQNSRQCREFWERRVERTGVREARKLGRHRTTTPYRDRPIVLALMTQLPWTP